MNLKNERYDAKKNTLINRLYSIVPIIEPDRTNILYWSYEMMYNRIFWNIQESGTGVRRYYIICYGF